MQSIKRIRGDGRGEQPNRSGDSGIRRIDYEDDDEDEGD